MICWPARDVAADVKLTPFICELAIVSTYAKSKHMNCRTWQRVAAIFRVPSAAWVQRCLMDLTDKKIAIIGLGYVGLPLAVEFGKVREVVGFDVNAVRVNELREGYDRTSGGRVRRARGRTPSELHPFPSRSRKLRRVHYRRADSDRYGQTAPISRSCAAHHKRSVKSSNLAVSL